MSEQPALRSCGLIITVTPTEDGGVEIHSAGDDVFKSMNEIVLALVASAYLGQNIAFRDGRWYPAASESNAAAEDEREKHEEGCTCCICQDCCYSWGCDICENCKEELREEGRKEMTATIRSQEVRP
jgi:hypothetical protein